MLLLMSYIFRPKRAITRLCMKFKKGSKNENVTCKFFTIHVTHFSQFSVHIHPANQRYGITTQLKRAS
jgi:hypothetical protein